jgi:diadenosine tetraphosphatase ApaH/serine/threonine PP2A family protein phosphatase
MNDFFLVHASPDAPSMWNYISSIEQAIYNFAYLETKICFIGHSHIPIIFVESNDDNYTIKRETSLDLKEDERYLINVGSVGQPRDNNPAAAFAIFDTAQQKYQLFRVPYNYVETQQKMQANNLPSFLIDRLGNGR